tara:strand:- start:30 stop:335 length:306 start_codon:yes stop_codon:yes gene_type:complete
MSYLLVAISILCIFSIYYCIKFAIMLINVRDAIENSLDVIDKNYNNISMILDIPVFNDSYEVKKALSSLEEARNSLLYVANVLTENNDEEEETIEYYDKKI